MTDPAATATGAQENGSLSSAFRRFATRASLIGSLMALSGPNIETDVAVPAIVRKAPPPAKAAAPPPGPSSAPPLSAAEQARRVQIRETLLQDARDNVGQMEAEAGTGYSRSLEALGSQLTARVKKANGGMHNSVVFIDPDKLDVALSLGLAPDFAVQTQLDPSGVSLSNKNQLFAGDKAVVAYQSKFGVSSYTQDPTAITNLKDPHPEACVVVPSSEYAPNVDIKGLSRAETVDFTNRHESWHCVDSEYNLRRLDPKKVAAVKPGTLASHINDMTTLEIYATMYRKESLADTGALGDMIRQEGKGTDAIDKVSAWRASDPHDLQHLSSPVLQGLKQRIDGMGIDKFRQLSDQDAQKLYFDVVDTYGMTAKSLQMSLKADAQGRPGYVALAEKAKTNPDAARAVILAPYVLRAPPKAPNEPLTPAEQAVSSQLQASDPEKQLEDRAFAQSGKITPQTLAKAYSALQEDLRGKMKAEPDNQLYPAEALKLQQTFMVRTRQIDYVQVNAERGLDLMKTEPSLAGLAAPAGNAVAGAPKAPGNG